MQIAALRENTELFPGPYLWLDLEGFIQYLELLLGLGFFWGGGDFRTGLAPRQEHWGNQSASLRAPTPRAWGIGNTGFPVLPVGSREAVADLPQASTTNLNEPHMLTGFSATLAPPVLPCCPSWGGSGGSEGKTSGPLHALHHLRAAEGCSSLELASPLARGKQDCKNSAHKGGGGVSAEDK